MSFRKPRIQRTICFLRLHSLLRFTTIFLHLCRLSQLCTCSKVWACLVRHHFDRAFSYHTLSISQRLHHVSCSCCSCTSCLRPQLTLPNLLNTWLGRSLTKTPNCNEPFLLKWVHRHFRYQMDLNGVSCPCPASFKSSAVASKGTLRTKTVCLARILLTIYRRPICRLKPARQSPGRCRSLVFFAHLPHAIAWQENPSNAPLQMMNQHVPKLTNIAAAAFGFAFGFAFVSSFDLAFPSEVKTLSSSSWSSVPSSCSSSSSS